MNNTFILILFFIAITVIIVGFIGYAVTTSRIIKGQEKEIARLQTLLKRREQQATVSTIQDSDTVEFENF